MHPSRLSVICAVAIAVLLPFSLRLADAKADPVIQAMVDQVTVEKYVSSQLAIESMGLGLYGGATYDMGYRNRDWDRSSMTGSLGFRETQLYLVDRFNGMPNFDVSVQGVYQNVVAELTGMTTPETVYVVGAHYDHVGGDRPGGDDDASGVAGLLEAAAALSGHQFESTVRFVAFSAEEDGLYGSRDYVASLPANETVAGMIQLDMILLPGKHDDPNSRPSPPDWEIDVDLVYHDDVPGEVAWADAFRAAAADYVPDLKVDASTVWTWRSDHSAFTDAGFPAFLAIENSINEISVNPWYHKYDDASDREAGLYYDYEFATLVTQAVAATVASEATPVSLPGDFNLDAAVDQDDLSLLLINWGAGTQPGDWESAFDGEVDQSELTDLLSNWGAGPEPAAVPEPAGFVLLCVGSLGILVVGLRRRKQRALGHNDCIPDDLE